MHFKDFSYGQGTEWEIFFGVGKISNIFWGCLKFLEFFGWAVDAGPEPTYAEKWEYPLPLGVEPESFCEKTNNF